MHTYQHPFVLGSTYHRRRDIHAAFGGQQQGGIATPKAAPLIFAITSETGTAYGYHDRFNSDGSFWYTGEGQVGDMQMLRGNAAIAHHAADGKQVLLFEELPQSGLRFLGEVECLGHHTERRPDKNGKPRDAIIFHLGFLPPPTVANEPPRRSDDAPPAKLRPKLPLADLKRAALEVVRPGAPLAERCANVARRAEAIRLYALARAQGKCEACECDAPFLAKAGPFLEVHHVFRLADGGPDHPAHVIALCPNCHRKAHYSIDAETFNESLVARLASREGSIETTASAIDAGRTVTAPTGAKG